MPANVRKAEIDIRTGLLIRELDATEPAEVKATPTPVPTPAIEGLDDPEWATDQAPERREIFVTDIPPEFRRIEFFIGGTVPPREMLAPDEPIYDDTGLSPEPEQTPAPSPTPSPPTPLTNTWENLENRSNNSNSLRRPSTGSETGISVLVCPVTGMRVNSNCPYSEARSFRPGTEPKDFCTLHR